MKQSERSRIVENCQNFVVASSLNARKLLAFNNAFYSNFCDYSLA